MQGDTRNGTPRDVINEAEGLYEYHYEPVYDTNDQNVDKKQLIGWRLITNHHWIPLIDPPRLIDQYQLAYYDARFTTSLMHLKWKTRLSATEVAQNILRNLDSSASRFPPPWPQPPSRGPVPFTFPADSPNVAKSL